MMPECHDDDENKPDWPSWAVGVLSGVRNILPRTVFLRIISVLHTHPTVVCIQFVGTYYEPHAFSLAEQAMVVQALHPVLIT